MEALGWDGALSSRDFYVAARAFADNWKEFNSTFPPWNWVPSPRLSQLQQQLGYLSLERICLLGSSKEDVNEVNHTGEEEASEPVDNATLVESSSPQVCYYDFHIVYSDSYRVPVLYFRSYYIAFGIGRNRKGPTCLLIEGFTGIKMDIYNSGGITQEEHPYLKRPWYKLHPCGTSGWMKLLFHGDNSLPKNGVAVEQYLVSWLSVVGQVVGIRIPFEMLNNHKSCN